MKTTLISALLFAFLASSGVAQQSDYAIKRGFEDRYKMIAAQIDSANAIVQLDSLKNEIGRLEIDYAPHEVFLDKALYPSTFAESMSKLKSLQVLTYDRVYLINTQGIKLSELEAKIASLTVRLDSLTAQRDQLFGELQESKKSVAALREAVKRLTANLQAKDKLIFALVDSIFLPYGKDLHQVADVQKEAIGQKLEKANVVTRVYEIAADNVKFLEVTQLQGKDYGNLIEQYQTFRNRWSGLKDKMAAVAATSAVIPTEPAPSKSGSKTPQLKGSAKDVKTAASSAASQAGHVDSVMAEWHTRLNIAFWGSLQKEFTSARVNIPAFADGQSFSASIRSYVANLKASSEDPVPFVETMWKGKIDKEWREALTKESMLGKTEYAALDKLVSELSRDSIDLTLILYGGGILAILAALWYFLFRKKKPVQGGPEGPATI